MFQHLQSCNNKLQEIITELGNIDAVVTKTMVESMIHQAVKVKENLKSSSAAQINSQIIDNLKTEFKQKEEYVALETEYSLYKLDEPHRITTAVSIETASLKHENESLKHKLETLEREKNEAVDTFKASIEFDQYVLSLPLERIPALKNFTLAVESTTSSMQKQIDNLQSEIHARDVTIQTYQQNQSIAADAATRAVDMVQAKLVSDLTTRVNELEGQLEQSKAEATWQRNLDTLQNGSKSGTSMEHYVIDSINSIYKTTLIAERTGSDGKSLDVRLKSTECDIAGIEVKNNKEVAKPEEYRTFEQVANKLCKEDNILIFAFMQFTDNPRFAPIEIIDQISHKIIKLTIFRQDRLLIEAGISNMITLILQLHARNIAGGNNDELDQNTDEYIIDTDNAFTVSDAISTRLLDLSKELDQMNKIMRNKCDEIKRTRGIKRKVDKVKSNTVIPKSNVV